MRIAKEVIFDLVVTVTAFLDEKEAIELANETQCGLACGIYTKDLRKSLCTARSIDTGVVFANQNSDRSWVRYLVG
jgi:acyl-CoA reductase-like NAD-dependent aldehyde dehydrogenase